MGTAEAERPWSPKTRWPRPPWPVTRTTDIKGRGIYAHVTLVAGVEPPEELRKELVQWVRKEIGPIAKADPDPVGAGPAQDPTGLLKALIRKRVAVSLTLGPVNVSVESSGRFWS